MNRDNDLIEEKLVSCNRKPAFHYNQLFLEIKNLTPVEVS